MNNFSTENHFQRYKQHLKSPQWNMLKKEYWWSNRPNSCWACDKKASADYANFNFHHRTYKNLFNETLKDVILLCRTHHADLEYWLIELKPLGETVDSWTPKYIKMMRQNYNLNNDKIAQWI
jgi:hypothetical protein